MYYDLWDIETNNAVGRFGSETEALDVVRTLLEAFGDAYADELQLGGEDGFGRSLVPVGGAALVALARRHGVTQPA